MAFYLTTTRRSTLLESPSGHLDTSTLRGGDTAVPKLVFARLNGLR